MTDLVIPSAEALDDFSNDNTDDFSTETKEQAILQAADLLWLATGITDQPEDERVARIVAYGILDMAWMLLIRTESKNEINSPFNSEHIGSYSYQKARQQLSRGLPSGVEWFDTAVALLLGQGEGTIWVQSEHVFTEPYCTSSPYAADPYAVGHDSGAVDVWWS